MNEKFAVFQWKANTFTIWQNGKYTYFNLNDTPTIMELDYSAINSNKIKFQLVLLG